MPNSAAVGVCSWSLRPGSPEELLQRVSACGLGAVQLALKPFHGGGRRGLPGWPLEQTLARLEQAGVVVRSAMFATRGEDYSSPASIQRTSGLRSEAHWPANLALARHDARRCRRLGVGLVSFHAGFLPESPGDPSAACLLERLARVVDLFGEQGVAVALETGQESASTLLSALEQLGRPELGVNFDPANMLLYGAGDPLVALDLLLPRVRQLHVKDALPPARPGEWGTELPLGQGAVPWPELLRRITTAGPVVDLMIERESGERRVADVTHAARQLSQWLAGS